MAFEDSDIYQAILDGDMAALGCSVGGQQDVNLRDSSGKSYLHICIELGQTDLVEYMAQRVFLGFRDDRGCTALDLAARYRMQEVERQLIRRVAGMQDSDDTEGLLQLFQSGWRAWPPFKPVEELQDGELSPGYRCQLQILELQQQVDKIHRAVHQGHLETLQEALTDESLALVSDHTGLPPLQKAVLFEWLSIVQYLSRGFPRSINHVDHMGRTALHYAASYTEYQDNIIYKQLVKAGASEDIHDLTGFRPKDYRRDASLFNLQQLREEVKGRINRSVIDYSSHLSWEEVHYLPNDQHRLHSRGIRRWRTIASVASFAHNSHRKVNRCKVFEETELYESIITNDVAGARYLLSHSRRHHQNHDEGNTREHFLNELPVNHLCYSEEGFSYLHLAVAHHVSPHLLSLLLAHLSPAHRDCDGMNPLELALLKNKNSTLAEVILNVILGEILRGDVSALQGLAQDGWQYWPSELYITQVLQPHGITQQVKHFLLTVDQFMTDVMEIHKAAILHQELDHYQSHMLCTDPAVTCLDNVGLSLAHLCVIFYNITLLTKLLHDFPFIANIRDSVGRTPLHYAAALDDDDYIYSLLMAAHARDDEEDLWGMRPCDYTTQKKRLLSPNIQEGIRDKLHNPLTLKPLWPTCLLCTYTNGEEKRNESKLLGTTLADDYPREESERT